MSGGYFDYDQHRISNIADTIEGILDKHQHPDEIRARDEYDEYDSPRDVLHETKSETVQAFQQALQTLRRATVYAQRIDWLLSGDDSEDCFLRRLKEDLKKLEK